MILKVCIKVWHGFRYVSLFWSTGNGQINTENDEILKHDSSHDFHHVWFVVSNVLLVFLGFDPQEMNHFITRQHKIMKKIWFSMISKKLACFFLMYLGSDQQEMIHWMRIRHRIMHKKKRLFSDCILMIAVQEVVHGKSRTGAPNKRKHGT